MLDSIENKIYFFSILNFIEKFKNKKNMISSCFYKLVLLHECIGNTQQRYFIKTVCHYLKPKGHTVTMGKKGKGDGRNTHKISHYSINISQVHGNWITHFFTCFEGVFFAKEPNFVVSIVGKVVGTPFGITEVFPFAPKICS